MKNAVLNTAAHAATPQGSKETLVEMIVKGSSRAIEDSEARGQALLVISDVLPSNLGGHDELFTKLGFVLGARVKDDEMFRYADLPPGWKKQASDHSMWSHILDAEGRERVAVFYKAAFYDRSAHAYLVGRYQTKLKDDKPDAWIIVDNKTGAVIYEPTCTDRWQACSDWSKVNLANKGNAVEQWEAT